MAPKLGERREPSFGLLARVVLGRVREHVDGQAPRGRAPVPRHEHVNVLSHARSFHSTRFLYARARGQACIRLLSGFCQASVRLLAPLAIAQAVPFPGTSTRAPGLRPRRRPRVVVLGWKEPRAGWHADLSQIGGLRAVRCACPVPFRRRRLASRRARWSLSPHPLPEKCRGSSPDTHAITGSTCPCGPAGPGALRYRGSGRPPGRGDLLTVFC